MNHPVLFLPNIELRYYPSELDYRLIIFKHNGKYRCARKSIGIKVIIMHLHALSKTRIYVLSYWITPYLRIFCDNIHVPYNALRVFNYVICVTRYVTTDKMHNDVVTIVQKFVTRKIKKFMRNYWVL